MNKVEVKRGYIFFADLSPVIGSEQGGVRPVLVIQNDVGNKYSPTVIIAAITSKIDKAKLPTHVEIAADEYGLEKDSAILLSKSVPSISSVCRIKNRTDERLMQK